MPGARPTIGVLSPLLGGEYFGTLLSGIQSAATDAGGRVIAIQTLDARLGDEHPGDSDFEAVVGWDHIDGFVVIINAVSPAYLASIRAAGKPVVMVSHEVPGFDCPIVVPDNRGGIREAVTHLVEHGHRSIAFAGNRRQQDIEERYESYRDTLLEHGIEPDDSLVYDTGDNLERGGKRAAEQMLAGGLPSTAIIVATDYSALGVMAVLSAAGLQLPRDQAVIGFDNTMSGAHAMPALSSVSQHFAFAGGTATNLLIDVLGGRAVANGRHQTGASLVARESCGCGSTVSFRTMFGTGVDGAVQRLVNRLVAPFAEAGQRTDAAVAAEVGAAGERIAAVFIGAAAADVARTPGVLAAAVEDIVRLSPSRESVIGIIGSVQELSRALLAGDDVEVGVAARLDSCLLELTLAAVEAQLHNEYFSNQLLRDSLRNEYDISLALLRRDETHPRALGWLAGTNARAGCVAVWDEPRPSDNAMTIAGFYDAHRGAVDDLTGSTCSPRSFPPAQILAAAGVDELVFVLPIKTTSRDWGFFSAVGPIATSTSAGRETYFQWAALLSVALDHEAVVESLSRQRESLAAAYDRERGLVESIQVSEERYALAARAANDGLWDWDLTSGEIFYSSRWKAMLGYDEASIGTRSDEWFDRVHADDLPGLLESMHARVGGEIESFEFEHRVRALDGGYRWMLCRALAVPGGGAATTRLVGSLTDITDRKELEDRLRQRALYDALTGLPNRTLFLDRLDRAIAHSNRRRDYHFVVLFLDLDGFKVVNDSLGHTAGDRLLVQVSDRIRAQLRESDTAARFGGDEFAILLNDVTDLNAVPAIVDRIQAALAVPYELDGHEVVVSASVGIAASTTGYQLPEDVIRDSDIAMYRAKSHERGSYATFDVSMHERAVERMRVESELRHGLENREFELRYQPIVELGGRQLKAMEALVRWRHPERGLIPPGTFLPVAEESGLIVRLGRLIVEEVCTQLSAWDAAGLTRGDMRVSVNVSNREFWHAGFQAHLDAALDAVGGSPEWLNLEITEGVIMHNPEMARKMLVDLRSKGFHLHVDDFGTGYSSLDALHRFPIEALKIDQSFVSRLESDRKSQELVRTIILMGHSLDMQVIAEGVETVAQERILQDFGCRYGQGYLFARPLPALAAREFLDNSHIVGAADRRTVLP